MIELGKTLKSAREAKGLSITQLSDLTHMAPSMIDELENEDFHRITAPIYGRGFIKLYCEAVGLDPKPITAEFMDIFTGNREPAIRERHTEPEKPTEPAVLPTEPADLPTEPTIQEIPPVAEPRISQNTTSWETEGPAVPQADLLGKFTSIPTPPPKPKATIPQEPVENAQIDQSALPETEVTETGNHALSRYATPLRQIHETATNSSALRFGILAIGALAILFGCFVGLRALYRATSAQAPGDERPGKAVQQQTPITAPRPEAQPAEKSDPAVKTPADAAVVPTQRTPQKIPSLYID